MFAAPTPGAGNDLSTPRGPRSSTSMSTPDSDHRFTGCVIWNLVKHIISTLGIHKQTAMSWYLAKEDKMYCIYFCASRIPHYCLKLRYYCSAL